MTNLSIHENRPIMKSLLLTVFFITSIMLFTGSIALGTDTTEIDSLLLERLCLKESNYKGNTFLKIEVEKDKDNDKPLARLCNEFLKENYHFSLYIANQLYSLHLKSQNNEYSVKTNGEKIKAFTAFLKENKQKLNSVFLMFRLFLKSKGYSIKDEGKAYKPHYKWEYIKETAIRNIYIKEILQNGLPRIKICVAGEGFMEKPQHERDLLMEAFTFQCIVYGLKEDKMGTALDECLTSIKKLKLVPQQKDGLVKARKLAREILIKNEHFDKLLRGVLESKKAYLPFEV